MWKHPHIRVFSRVNILPHWCTALPRICLRIIHLHGRTWDKLKVLLLLIYFFYLKEIENKYRWCTTTFKNYSKLYIEKPDSDIIVINWQLTCSGSSTILSNPPIIKSFPHDTKILGNPLQLNLSYFIFLFLYWTFLSACLPL